MISKFFDGLIEQIYDGVKTSNNNIAMVCYSNDMSILELDSIRNSSEKDDILLISHEFAYDELTSAYEPFLDIICNLHRKYIGGDFGEFLESCDVYPLQKDMLISYYQEGICIRKEPVLLDEVSYERNRLDKTLCGMIEKLAQVKPFIIVINRFQRASRSSVEFARYLTEKQIKNFGMIFGVNEGQVTHGVGVKYWEKIRESLDNVNMVYYIGNTGIRRPSIPEEKKDEDLQEVYRNAVNIFELLDYDTANEYFKRKKYLWKEKLNDEDSFILIKIIYKYINALILSGNMPRAIELINIISKRLPKGHEHEVLFWAAKETARSYSYQGKLDKALEQVEIAKKEAKEIGDEKLVFEANLLEIESKMSGWHNLLFVAEDMQIDSELIAQMMKYGYSNYLAHIYVYSYDNGPEMVAMAYRSEAFLKYFSQGIAIAKEIDNEVLLYNAFQKNLMIAATNGMSDIALLFDIRMYQSVKNKKSLEAARVLSSIGYNLSAIGFTQEAFNFFDRAIELLYELQEGPDIAEVLYNKGINYMACREYENAEHCFHIVLKIIDRLHLNSIRVCNVSKLYALMALVSILQNKKINCERYLISCKPFLDYVMEKEGSKETVIVLHDYLLADDDMFLYNFACSYKEFVEGNYEKALEYNQLANIHFMKSEGNQFYTVEHFREQRLELFKVLGKMDLYRTEESITKKYKETVEIIKSTTSLELLKEIDIDNIDAPCNVSDKMIADFIRRVGAELDYKTNKQYIAFISQWQKYLDDKDSNVADIVDSSMKSFLNYFRIDKALYIRCSDEENVVYFNNSEKEFSDKEIKIIVESIKECPEGFVTSKIGDSFSEHYDLISIFGATDVFSFAGIPIFNNDKLEAVFITYVLMVDNWHNSFSRNMFSEDELSIYTLLFRNLEDGISKIEANIKVYQMNKLLEKNSVTDILTGLYNRFGLYREVNKLTQKDTRTRLSVMFIDLDNFKPYNDTYGHDIGDIVLKKMANIFNVAGKGGIVCRYGGDEFLIILEEADKEELIQRAEKIYSMIEEADGFRTDIQELLGKSLDKNACNIGCSIGIASAEILVEEDIDKLIKNADDTLYKIKLKDKGTYAFL